MTPKEKAKKLFNKIYNVDDPMGNYPMCFDTAKLCALVAVDEILEAIKDFQYGLQYLSNRDYWLEVKEEIENL